MRYVVGIVLFGAFVIFSVPAKLAVVLSVSDGSGNPSELVAFGMTCAAVLGIPGYFAFPYERRLQALAWLALGCMAYGMLLVSALTMIKTVPFILTDEGARAFFETVTIHYVRFGVIVVLEVAVWALLFRRTRLR